VSEPLRLTAGLVLATFSALGYGRLAARLLKIEGTLAADGVIGTTILTTIFAVVHFFFALQQTVNLATLVPGILCLAILFKRRFLIELPVIAAMVWWAVRFSQTGGATYDQGLYHLQTMLWNNTDHIIAGLANIHALLGYNQFHFILAAGLNIPILGGWSLSFLAAALVEALIVADLLFSIRSSTEKIAKLYSLVVVVFVLAEPRWILSPSYLSPEPVVALGVLYAFLLFLDQRKTVLLLWIPFLLTAKLSSLPLLLLLDWNRESLRKPAAAVGALILAVWLAGNIVLTGYLAFPVAVSRLPLPWAVERARAEDLTHWITSWARGPGKTFAETSGLKWLRPWANRMYDQQELRGALAMFVAGILLLVYKKALRRLDLRLLLAIAAGLIFWFAAAPDPRYAKGFIFGAALLMVAYATESLELLQFDPSNTVIVIALLACWLGVSAAQERGGEDWPKTEYPPVRVAMTHSGYAVWTPVSGDQCWTVLVCTPAPHMTEYFPKRVIPMIPTK
jgi:hypothetical protein